MKKALFIISLRYPLINAINIKMHELQDKPADIILDDTIRNDSYQLAENLRKSQIFDNVFFTNPAGYDGLKNFFQNFNIHNSFIKACYGSYLNLKLKYLYKFNQQKYLDSVVINGGHIDLSLYDDIYVCSQSEISWLCLNDLTQNNAIKNINLVEEGLSIYLNDDIVKKYSQMYPKQKIFSYLYEPDLLTYCNNSENIISKKIPKMSIYDKSFIEKLNYIFSYKYIKPLNNKIIFFEQVFESMPSYFKNKFLKIFLYNSYKKHLKKDNLFNAQLNIINELINILISRNLITNFYIKLHPRTKNIKTSLTPYLLENSSNKSSIPWEIYCLNQNCNDSIWITLYSSSVLNKILCFQEIEHIKFIFLYKSNIAFQNEAYNLEKFYTKFSKLYSNYILIPNNLNELTQLIKHTYK